MVSGIQTLRKIPSSTWIYFKLTGGNSLPFSNPTPRPLPHPKVAVLSFPLFAGLDCWSGSLIKNLPIPPRKAVHPSTCPCPRRPKAARWGGCCRCSNKTRTRCSSATSPRISEARIPSAGSVAGCLQFGGSQIWCVKGMGEKRPMARGSHFETYPFDCGHKPL